MKDEAVLELAGVSFRRGGRTVLEGIDWRVRRGEHWALLGANGSGKTSLLRIVSAYEWPNDGTVSVLGRQFGSFDLRELRPFVGVSTSALAGWFDGDTDPLTLVLSGLDGWTRVWREFSTAEQERGRAALARVGGGAIAGRWGVLSQGERQRVMIARALVNDPALLILDEPCAGLDPAGREELLVDLERLAATPSPPSMLLVTHHVEEISPFVNRVLVLRQGRVLAQGPSPEVITSPVLSGAFGRPCEVTTAGGRFQLRVVGASR